MRRGKECAQAAHASMKWLVDRIKPRPWYVRIWRVWRKSTWEKLFSQEERKWMEGLFTKVCVQVNDEKEFDEIYHKARQLGLNVNVIWDAGLTEFNGVPTKTCLAIGPNKSEEIDKVTGHLKLY